MLNGALYPADQAIQHSPYFFYEYLILRDITHIFKISCQQQIVSQLAERTLRNIIEVDFVFLPSLIKSLRNVCRY